jgi:hypothetical protein
MRNTTVVILALAVLLLAGLTFIAGRKSRQLRDALDAVTAERGRLRDRVGALEERERALTAENADLRAAAPPPGRPPPRAFTMTAPKGRLPGPMAAFDSPEMRRLMALDQKGRLDLRYAALFKALHLNPAQLDRFKQLLVDKQNSAMDVLAAAHNQDLLTSGDGSAVKALMQQENQSVDAAIRAVLGDTAYEEYQDFERTQPERRAIDQLASRLSYTDTPLTTEQAEALVNLLSAERTAQPAASATPATSVQFAMVTPGGDAAFSLMGGGPPPPITDEAVADAQAILSEPQLEAMRELQAEQQARERLGELMREAMPVPPPPPGGGDVFVGGTRAGVAAP